MADEGEELVLEDNIEPAAAMEDIYVEPWRQSTTPSIHVCVGGACSQDGSHATLAEIEDLVAASGGGCKVATDWCFGRCGAGPNVLVVNDGNDRFLTGMRSLDDSITAVKLAMGRGPTVAVELEAKLKQARRVHALEQDLSRAEMMVHCSACTSDDATFDRHLANALTITDRVVARAGAAHPLLQAQHLRRQIVAMRSNGRGSDDDILDCTWERVACWRLESVELRSACTAVYTFASSDPARVTHGGRRARCGGGDGGSSGGVSHAGEASARTWHVTLRAELDASAAPASSPADCGGEEEEEEEEEEVSNDDMAKEPPSVGMPEVVARDYTPLSTEAELERGVLRLLIKTYPNGKVRTHFYSMSADPITACIAILLLLCRVRVRAPRYPSKRASRLMRMAPFHAL